MIYLAMFILRRHNGMGQETASCPAPSIVPNEQGPAPCLFRL